MAVDVVVSRVQWSSSVSTLAVLLTGNYETSSQNLETGTLKWSG